MMVAKRKAGILKQLKQLKKFKSKISPKYNPEKVIFFGSRVSGTLNKDSDVDLIVVSRNFNDLSVLKRSPDLYLEWDLDYPVDFLCCTPEEFNKLKDKVTIVSEAIKSGIEV